MLSIAHAFTNAFLISWQMDYVFSKTNDQTKYIFFYAENVIFIQSVYVYILFMLSPNTRGHATTDTRV